MTIRTRFAPSPTGYLHIGGARTALYSYLFAKAHGGKCLLRIEDTDLERSKREFEAAQVEDLKWLGIEFDESPSQPGEFGPYRQSERGEIYKKYVDQLIDGKKAYPCFLTTEELEQLTKKAEEEKTDPHKYHGRYRDLDSVEAKKRIDAGQEYVVRFKNPAREWTFKDMVRGEVTFPINMVGDFVIMRSNGMAVYNFCCVIDDALMRISHVIRAEEHLNNTVRQLMIYDACNFDIPQFAHCSLLVGEDRQKLSKRHGATSVGQYKDLDYIPGALINYLCLLGWSHPEEKDIFDINELGELFDSKRFSKSPALYDIKKLNYFNEQYLRALPLEKLVAGFENVIAPSHPFHGMTAGWKESFSLLFKEKVQLFKEVNDHIFIIFSEKAEMTDELKEILSWETTPKIKEYVASQLKPLEGDFLPEDTFNEWMSYCKKELKIKGKPLFMGLRGVMTGVAHGPDLKSIVGLTPLKILKTRIESL